MCDGFTLLTDFRKLKIKPSFKFIPTYTKETKNIYDLGSLSHKSLDLRKHNIERNDHKWHTFFQWFLEKMSVQRIKNNKMFLAWNSYTVFFWSAHSFPNTWAEGIQMNKMVRSWPA